MSVTTAIEWTDATWSPWEGCTKVSPGCDHCYAEGMNRWLRKGENWGPGAPRRIYSEDHWDKPLRWNAAAERKGERLRVFPSVCDPLDNEAPDRLREHFWHQIDLTPWIDWLLLTKRIGNARAMLPERWLMPDGWPKNVRLGATMVNQEEWDRDIGKLLALRCPNFVSLEPLLGPIDMTGQLWGRAEPCDGCPRDEDCECGWHRRSHFASERAIDWVIVGGESGRFARPMHPDWARSLRDQCAAAGVPFLFKQWGAWAPGAVFADTIPSGEYCDFDGTLKTDDERVWHVPKKAAGRLLDGIEHNGFPPSASKSSEP